MKTMYRYALLFVKNILVNKKRVLISLTFLFVANVIHAQLAPMDQRTADSLHKIIESNASDSNNVHAFYWLSRGTTLSNINESVESGNKGLDLARKIKFPMGELECLEALSFSYAITSSFEKGFSTAYASIDLSKKIAPVRQIYGINMMGLLTRNWEMKKKHSGGRRMRTIILI